MIMGDRGTGKSTIRAIADLLPEIEVVKDDPFNSHKSDLDLGNEVKSAIQTMIYETELIKIPMIDYHLEQQKIECAEQSILRKL
jgi:magnesium chelatase subunit I